MTQCVAALPVLMLVVASGGCGGGEDTLFERLPAGRTGIDFTNRIVENDSLLNPLDFSYVYNGAGVGVGDFDGDGRPDLYFAGNVVDNALYLNRGDVEFEDVTEAAGATAEGAWSTGVATVDINQDGRMDICVCVAGPDADARGNRLLINQGTGEEGVPRFREAAAEYGLADTGYSTQAAFFDYDQDGDLDLYLLTNSIDQGNRNAPRPIKTKGQAPSTDRLYRNEGDSTFTNVSEEAGIQTEGFGLGVNVGDINQDGWPDIYVANDFLSNDLLWINQGDGTFENRLSEATKHQSHSGMGNDVADFNNDGRPDIAVVDMLPPRNERQKLMLPGRTYSVFTRACVGATSRSTCATPSNSTAAAPPTAAVPPLAKSASSRAWRRPTGAGPRSLPTSTTTVARTSSSPTATARTSPTSTTSSRGSRPAPSAPPRPIASRPLRR